MGSDAERNKGTRGAALCLAAQILRSSKRLTYLKCYAKVSMLATKAGEAEFNPAAALKRFFLYNPFSAA